MNQSAPHDWLYVILCLVVPLAWGVVSARVFDWWQSRRAKQTLPENSDDLSVDMYHI